MKLMLSLEFLMHGKPFYPMLKTIFWSVLCICQISRTLTVHGLTLSTKLQVATIATIGLVGSSVNGLTALNNKSLLEDFCNSFRSSAGHVKVACLQSFSQLFAIHGPQDTQATIEKISEHIFHNMSGERQPHYMHVCYYSYINHKSS